MSLKMIFLPPLYAICALCSGLLMALFMIWAGYFICVHYTQANIVSVYLNGEHVYTGPRAYIHTTMRCGINTIEVYERLFPWPVTKHYVSSYRAEVRG